MSHLRDSTVTPRPRRASEAMVVRHRCLALLLPWLLAGCHAAQPAASPRASASAAEASVLLLADSILAAARARDADRFAAHFAPGDELRYVFNTRAPVGQVALRSAFRAMLARQVRFDPRWTDRQVQVLAPDAAVFTGAFRTAARDTTGREWGALGVVTFVARQGPSGWKVVNWHTSETPVP